MVEARYARQELVPGFEGLSDKLHGLTLGIIGLGGLGGLCAYLLAGAGVLRFKLADFDEVSVSNLHRQVLYSAADEGYSKAQLSLQRLKALDERVEAELYGRVAEENFLDFAKSTDLILDLCDSHDSRLIINDLCVKAHMPLLHAAVSGTRGQLALFNFADPVFIQRYGCYRCLAANFGALKGPVGILGPAAAAMASLTALEALKHFAGLRTEGEIVFYELLSAKTQRLRLHADRHCLCQKG